MEGRVCPRCGYKRKKTELVPDNECPGCGIIYDKFAARQQTEALQQEQIPEAFDAIPGYTPPKRSSWSTFLAAVLALMMVALLAGGAYVTYTHYWQDTAEGTTKKAASFSYDIRGTWRGRLTTDVRTGPNRTMKLVYKMKVVIGPEYQVDRLAFTDVHALHLGETRRSRSDKPEVSCEISWFRPDEAELSCDCLEYNGNYTYPYVRLIRSYRWLSLYYKHEFVGEISLEADDVYSENQGNKMDQDGYFKFERSTKSLKALVDVQITPESDLTFFQDAVKTFRLAGIRLDKATQRFEADDVHRLVHNTYAAPGFTGIVIRSPDGPEIRMDIEDPTRNVAFEPENLGRSPLQFFYLTRLSDEFKLHCRIEKKSRKVEIQFYPDGRKTARVLDRFAAPGDSPLVFQLEKD